MVSSHHAVLIATGKRGASMKPPKSSVTIIGRRWFEKTNGNTYNTAQIIVDGEPVHKTDFQYGYGNQFEWIALQWLEENGYMPDRRHYPNGGGAPGWQYFRDERGLNYHVEAIDVQRKKDL
jgi:hypothetical protein